MLITLNLQFLGRLFAWRPLPRARRRPGAQISLQAGIEGLEDRSLLTNFVVNTPTDVVDPTDNFLSLREAITAANADVAADTITFSTALIGQTIQVTAGRLLITNPLTITGRGALNTVIDAQGNSGVFEASGTAGDLTFRGVTITGGRITASDTFGAGINYEGFGTLTVIDSEIRGNSTTGSNDRGGGIGSSAGDIVLIRSTVAQNSTSGVNSPGGGIASLDGDITLVDSTVSGNTTSGDSSGGGGIATLDGTIHLINSTVASNQTTGALSSSGGGIFSEAFDAFLTLDNSIVAKNTAGSDQTEDIDTSTVTIANSSLIGVDFGSGLTPAPLDAPDFFGNFIGSRTAPVDPLIGSLALNGGETRTHKLLNSSPAINAGNNLRAVDQNGVNLGLDQTGQPRIFDGVVDMGAYELQKVITTPLVYFKLAAETITEGTGAFSITVTLSQPTDTDVMVQFAASGTALRDADYSITTLSPVVIPAGSTTATIDFNVTDDNIDENNEVVSVQIRRATNATVGDPFVETVTILDNDGADAGGPTNILLTSNVVNENAPNTLVGVLSATDPDIGDFAGFVLLPGGQGDQFVISGNQLKVGPQGLDFESLKNGIALVNVKATDSTGKSFIKQLRITVANVNEPPVIPEGQFFSVPEDAVAGTLVGTVLAIDPDTNTPSGNLKYSIVSGNVDDAFRISAGSGDIHVQNAAALDAETNPIYGLEIQVVDPADPTMTTTQFVVIEISDVNEPPVIVPDQNLFVNEHAHNGTVVGTVEATDPDFNFPNNLLTYSIIGGNTNNAFSINPVTGNIIVSNSSQLNFANGSTYSLLVEVDDSGDPSFSDATTVTVNLVDVNEPPTITPGESFNLDENPAFGQIVGAVTASDPDATAPNNTLTYLIAGGNPGAAFAIDSATGLIKVNNPTAVDFETTPQFNLQVRVVDGGSPARSALTTVVVTLNDVNDPPIIAPDQEFSLGEDATFGTVVGTVVGSDPDSMSPGNQATFSIVGGNTGNAFAIDPNTGALTVSTTSLDRETTPTYALTIRLMDDTGLSTTSTVTINVLDVNEAPELINIGVPPAYIRGQTRNVAILPLVIVNDPDGPTDLAEVRISLPIPPGARNPDRLLLKGVRKLGRVTSSVDNDRRQISITLKQGVTSSQVQTFLHNITFSTRATGLSLDHRDIQVQVIDRQGAASNVITQDISVQ